MKRDRAVASPLAIFEDETSIGLAHAFGNAMPGRSVSCWFETDLTDDARLALDRLGIAQAELVSRAADDAHLARLEAALADLAAGDVSAPRPSRGSTAFH